VTTPEFRNQRVAELEEFVLTQLPLLCARFEVLTTGGTYQFITDTVRSRQGPRGGQDSVIADLDDAMVSRLTPLGRSIVGMIELTFELVEGRLDAVLHLTNWEDVVGKPDSMALRREANVHNVFIASDLVAARLAVASWTRARIGDPSEPTFPPRPVLREAPLDGLPRGARVLALIAHDQMKLEMCRFFVEHMQRIFDDNDFVLATGTTGKWIKRFAVAAGRSQRDVDAKVRLCYSGPLGGDIQIAAAAVRGICRRVIFFQDPLASHVHEPDIRLFEQAVLFRSSDGDAAMDIALATNPEAARVLLGA
jgi:methylglyoxal synthase